jgi:Transglutaminase-like superfamily
MSLKSGLHKLRARSPAERRLLVEALVAVALASTAVPLVPFRHIARFLGLTQGSPADGLEPVKARDALAVAWAVQAAAARMPWHCSCLTEALAASVMLRRREIPATLYLGVATNVPSADGIAAHAWVRCGEKIVVGRSGHEQFTPVARFS